jgi:hypothetical protein
MIEVAVVIPLYKAKPSESELLSFQQCLTILGEYPILLIVPFGFNSQVYDQIAGKKLAYVYFDKKYFTSTKGYSKLLLSKSFYKRFLSYAYILIYQLDAWVFRNELLSWCRLDYDYIGAPWLEAPPITSGKKPILNLSSYLENRVGNGGFSLRKVASHIRWSPWVSFLFKFIPKNEDVLWTLFVPFKKPSCIEALAFAFEMDPKKSFELNGNKLPFGCHAWEKYDPDFWSRMDENLSLPNKEING